MSPHPEIIHGHAIHNHGVREPQQVTPRQRGQHGESEDDDNAVPPKGGCIGGHEVQNLIFQPSFPKSLSNTGGLLIGIVADR
jgi:hypothetical protein